MTQKDLLRAVHQLGWSIIPTKLDKKSAVRWAEYQKRKPTNDELKTWVKANWPGWAVVTGTISGMICIDGDGETGRATLALMGFAPHCKTGGGGHHLYVKHPGVPVRTLNGKSDPTLGAMYPGVDIRGDGGYAIFCGCTDKGSYEWLRDVELVEWESLPEQLREYITGSKSEPAAVPANTRALRTTQPEQLPPGQPLPQYTDPRHWLDHCLAKATKGSRNQTGLDLANLLRDQCIPFGVSRSECEHIMREYADRVPRDAKDKYTHSDAMATLNKALSYATRPPAGVPAPRASVIRGSQTIDQETGEILNGIPEIVVGNRQQRDVTMDALDALEAGNNPAKLFTRAGQIVRLRPAGESTSATCIIDLVGVDIIRSYMSRTANYIKYTAKGDVIETYPPIDNARDILSWGEWPFPPLDTITASPAIRADGSILDAPGYDAETKLYYMPESGFKLDAVPRKPTTAQTKTAVEVIHDILADFPFISPADYANAIGLMLTPLLRSAIPGCVPLAVVNAPQPGTGKGLLARMINVVTTGRDASMMTAPDNKEEWRKAITTHLLNGSTIITIDNVEQKLFDSNLASVLTVAYWSDRLLGTNKSVDIPNKACFIATGNNVKLGGDLPRRCFWITINPKTSRPELRSGFRHSDLLDYCARNRGKIIAALLTMCRSWYAAKCPIASTPVIGSFEQWSTTIGGILETCGIANFLANAEDARKKASDDDDGWEAFLEYLSEKYEDTPFTTHEINESIPTDPSMLDAIPDCIAGEYEKRNSFFVRRLGTEFAKHEGKCYGLKDLSIEKTGRKYRQKTLWVIVSVSKLSSSDSHDSHFNPNACKNIGEDNIPHVISHVDRGETDYHDYHDYHGEKTEELDDDEGELF